MYVCMYTITCTYYYSHTCIIIIYITWCMHIVAHAVFVYYSFVQPFSLELESIMFSIFLTEPTWQSQTYLSLFPWWSTTSGTTQPVWRGQYMQPVWPGAQQLAVKFQPPQTWSFWLTAFTMRRWAVLILLVRDTTVYYFSFRFVS